MAITRPPRLREATHHAALVHRIYHDPRPTRLTRQLLLTIAYVLTIHPTDNNGVTWDLIEGFLDQHDPGNPYRHYSLAEHIRDDAPRYEAPSEYTPATCPARRKRARKPAPAPATPVRALHLLTADTARPAPDPWVCGTPTRHFSFAVFDPDTGEISTVSYCSRHRTEGEAHADRVREQNRTAPRPAPNRGGVLPSYFQCNWEKVYAFHVPGWKPPAQGICADDWPQTRPDPAGPVFERPRLTLIHSR